ncbi:MAG: hypothetical protein LBR51_06870 [Bacteroidales bacterium]|jgi:hypothetical protein|nr:hypothetical protein [Bacteroidales bacterium]
MMKIKSIVSLIMIFFMSWVVLSCSPRVYGQTKRKKLKNCGCEHLYPTHDIENNKAYFASK